MGDSFDISDNRRTVLALKSGDEAAFKAVYTAWSTALCRYADTILHNETDARELVQELFVSLWLHRRRLDETKSLRNYLLRAIHNNALRECQRREIRRRREELFQNEQKRQLQPENAVDERNTCPEELLLPAIARLPRQSRRVVEMNYLEQKKHAVIASELSISRRTVETILYKALRRLRGEIKKK